MTQKKAKPKHEPRPLTPEEEILAEKAMKVFATYARAVRGDVDAAREYLSRPVLTLRHKKDMH